MAASSADSATRPSSKRSRAARRRKRLGSTTARVFTPPLVTGPPGPCGCGCALTSETSLGFAVEQFAAEVLEVTLIPWERWFLIHALELRGDGTFRFRTIILLVARQNGKSTVLQILSLWMLYVLGIGLVIGTAQNLDVAEEQWQAAVAVAEEVEELAEEIAQISRTNGKKYLKLIGGQRYKVAAASRRGGRGLSGDLVILDELREHQSWDAWAAVTKTTMARLLALIIGASNAGDAASVVLRYLRVKAHLAIGDPDGIGEDDELEVDPDVEFDDDEFDEDTLGIFEWSAAPGRAIRDRDGWAEANPSLGYTITERAIASAAGTDPEWTFRTEVLCQWMEGTREGPFPPGAWEACLDVESTIEDPDDAVFCVDVSWDRSTAHIAAAGWRDDGNPHAEIIASRTGVDWVVGWLTDPAHPDRRKHPVVIQSKRSPASSLVDPLVEAGIQVVEWTGEDLGVGTADLYDRVRAARPDEDTPGEPGVYHLKQPLLDAAAANAATRPVGDAWLWDRRKSSVDIAPLVAITGALWGLIAPEDAPPPPATAPSTEADGTPARGGGIFDRGARTPLSI